MRGLTSAVHWWEEWQLRVLVLSSLAIQFLLFTFSRLRRQAIPGWLRFIAWLAYLGSDAVAIYALATLFNRHKLMGEDGEGSSGMLQVVWAPILLIHLGGDDGITANNIEDNELWSRHLLTTVSQVTVAIYVFWKTWPPGGGDKRLLQAAIVLFVPGVLKCFQKPWALKSASIYSLVSSPAAVKQKEEGGMYAHALEEYVKRAKDFVFVVREQTEAEGEAQGATRASASMEDEGNDEERAGTGTGRFRRATAFWRRAMLQWSIMTDNIEREARARFLKKKRGARAQRVREMYQAGHNESSKLFVDLSSSYSRRLSILEHFCGLTEKRAYGSVQQGLATAFLLLYTKLKTVNTDHHAAEGVQRLRSIFPLYIQVSRQVLPWAAIGLFHHSHREAYNDIDVKITYIILCCTAVLENSSIGSFTEQLTPTGEAGEEWPEMVSQYSFIGYFARNMKHSKIMWIVSLLGCRDFLDQHWCMKPCFSSARISELVLGYLIDGWKKKIRDATSYRRFNNHHNSEGLRLSTTREKQPLLFDESVLLWHIVTDLCFFRSSSSGHRCSCRCQKEETNKTNCEAAVLCTQMSNYMAYLLFINPEMLLPGSRRNLFTAAHQELEAIFKDDNQPLALDNQRELTLKIIRKLESSSQADSGPPETIIHDAWMIAQKLQSSGNEKKMWEVIQGIWVQMLCYSAGRCRGYLHAKALGKGGEFLSYVWLLLFYMGMETFTDKLQRDDLTSHEAAGTGNNATISPPSTSEQAPSTTGIAASASEAHTDAAGASAAPSTSEICIAEDMV